MVEKDAKGSGGGGRGGVGGGVVYVRTVKTNVFSVASRVYVKTREEHVPREFKTMQPN